MTRLVPLAVAIVLVVCTGVVSGIWTGRWAPSLVVEKAAARLDNVPLKIGDWEGEAEEFNVQDYKAAGIRGGLVRRYRNHQTGDEVTLMIVCGKPGPISVHKPEDCYPAAGYRLLSERIATPIQPGQDEPPSHFWTWHMGKLDGPVPRLLNVTYAWSEDGTWQAPERDPRFAFAAAPVLYKMYAVREVPPSANAPDEANTRLSDDDPAIQLLEEVIPELRRVLFPTGKPAA
jgi:hypothetical protein